MANARTRYGTAKRDFETFKALDEKKLASANEVGRTKDALDEAEKTLAAEQKRLQVTTGAIDEQLRLARQNIDLLGLLQEKTKGNLTGDEERLLDQALYDLRMRFLEVAKEAP